MKFGVREICDVVFKAKADTTIGSRTFAKGEPVLYIDTAKTSTLEGAATTVYATGGRGNSRLLAWEGEKTLTFTVEDAMISPLGFSVLTGAGIVDAAAGAGAIQSHMTLEVLTEASGVIEIDGDALGLTGSETATVYINAKAPIFATVLDEAGAVASGGYLGAGVATGSVVTANAAGTPTKVTLAFTPGSGNSAPTVAGVRVRLDFYLTMTSGVQELSIDAGKFAGYYYVEAATLFRDQATGKDLPAEIIIPKAKIQSNFNFSMASTGDPSTFSFVMDAFPAYTTFSSKQVLCAIQITSSTPVG